MKKRFRSLRVFPVLLALMTLGYCQGVDAGPRDPVQGVIIGRRAPKGPKGRRRPLVHQFQVPNAADHLLVQNTRIIRKRAWRRMLEMRAYQPGETIGLDLTPLPFQLKLYPLHEPTRPVPYDPKELKAPSGQPIPRPTSPR